MDPITVIAASIGAVVIACAVASALGLLVLRRLRNKAPQSPALAQLTPAGLFLLGSFVMALLAGGMMRFLAPESDVGSFLQTTLGLVAGTASLWLACVAIAVALHLLGYPVYEKTAAVQPEPQPQPGPDDQSGSPT